RLGKNTLKVVLKAIRKILSGFKNTEYNASFNKERIFIRKAQCHFGWDWCPDFPGTGIYRSVKLCYGNKNYIDNVKVDTYTDGLINFIVETSLNNRKQQYKDIQGEIKIEVIAPDGTKYFNRTSLFGNKNSLTVLVESPKLWFPNGYGEQPLYKYIVSLAVNGEEVDSKTGRFGIREIEIKEPVNIDGSRRFDLYVNGTRVRCVGGNWVPICALTGAIPKTKYYSLLKTAYSGGFNMLRVWGGGIYENDEFYDYCDEFGILVWQDFMFSCQTIPDDNLEFREKILTEATEQVKRLRNHPSLALWCAGNEISDSFSFDERKCGRYISKIMLAGVIAEYDGKRRYLSNSPYSATDLGNDLTSGDCHRGTHAISLFKNDFENFRKYQIPNKNNFDSECAILGMCRLRSFKKFIPNDKLWPQNDLWRDRLVGNPYDYVIQDFTERLKVMAEKLFGASDCVEDFIKKSMMVHAEILGSEADYFRSYEFNSGFLTWMYNDNCGNGTWSIVDDATEPKPAFYALKRAGKRRRVSITEDIDGFYVNVINDTADDYCGPLLFSHEKITGKVLVSKEKEIKVKAFTQIKEKVDFDKTEKGAFLYAETEFDRTIFFYDLWKDKTFVSDLTVKKQIEGKNAKLTITANEFARTVFIDLPDGYYPLLSDNYFDLKRGATATVDICAERDIAESDIKVLTFADRWPE
ncbi:MAG: hypothetical protein J6Y43_03630, partial [Clostridia bacterium]|nr:hypothetical protein [Clostridia bacterium]